MLSTLLCSRLMAKFYLHSNECFLLCWLLEIGGCRYRSRWRKWLSKSMIEQIVRLYEVSVNKFHDVSLSWWHLIYFTLNNTFSGSRNDNVNCGHNDALDMMSRKCSARAFVSSCIEYWHAIKSAMIKKIFYMMVFHCRNVIEQGRTFAWPPRWEKINMDIYVATEDMNSP